MAIKKKSLRTQLTNKAVSLRTTAADKNEASDALSIASSRAAQDAVEAARLAVAVEQAIGILEAAGVDI